MDSDAISVEIVQRIAASEGVDPQDLDVPLYDVIDPDALETLVAGARDGSFEVAFTYHGYDVVVDGEGTVSVNEPQPGEDATDG